MYLVVSPGGDHMTWVGVYPSPDTALRAAVHPRRMSPEEATREGYRAIPVLVKLDRVDEGMDESIEELARFVFAPFGERDYRVLRANQ